MKIRVIWQATIKWALKLVSLSGKIKDKTCDNSEKALTDILHELMMDRHKICSEMFSNQPAAKTLIQKQTVITWFSILCNSSTFLIFLYPFKQSSKTSQQTYSLMWGEAKTGFEVCVGVCSGTWTRSNHPAFPITLSLVYWHLTGLLNSVLYSISHEKGL